MAMQVETRILRVEPLTEEAFAPFGELVRGRDEPPRFEADGNRMWDVGFEAAGATEILAVATDYAPFRFTKLERHFGVTQTFVPVSGPPSVIVVAPPTAPERTAIPDPREARAFLVDREPYVLRKGTWHYSRLPLAPPRCEWLVITDRETTADIVRHGASGSDDWELSQIVDYEEAFGVAFGVAL
jgi:ureidoglycolate hydrolase